MPSPLQQATVQRKLIYFGLILVLFTISWFHRRYVVEARADELALREESQGEVRLTDAAVRFTLTGSRGFAVCILWLDMIEKQKKHQWNEMDQRVRVITKLQPHFTTPWLFQSWNLSYNVSVESDRVKDKYFYIARGIELLAEGERQNRDHPDLRSQMGFYYQNKIGIADEQHTLRCLFQMSCMDPVDRDPRRFRTAEAPAQINLEEFEKFCRKYPHLVRRLRDTLRCKTPTDVIDFLAANQTIPTRYQETPASPGSAWVAKPSKLKPAEQQFPVLAPEFDRSEPTAAEVLGQDFDNYHAARAWFSYAQKPLPEPTKTPTPTGYSYDQRHYRLPRFMATMLFRQSPQLAQTAIAIRLRREGWYDEGWAVDEGQDPDKHWFPGRTVVVGQERNWAGEAWAKAHEMWKLHGERNGLHLEAEDLDRLQQTAKKFQQAHGLRTELPCERGPTPRPDQLDETLRASMAANQQLYWYGYYRNLTNFLHFYDQSRVEAQEATQTTRKRLFRAEQARKAGNSAQALQLFEQAFPPWRKILEANPNFRSDSEVEEETYEMQLKYLDLVHRQRGTDIKHLLVWADCLLQFGSPTPGNTLWLPPAQLLRARSLAAPVQGPFDDLIGSTSINRVRNRLGLTDDQMFPSAKPSP